MTRAPRRLTLAAALLGLLTSPSVRADPAEPGSRADVAAESRRYARWVSGTLGIDYAAFSRDYDQFHSEIQAASTGLYTLKTADVQFLDLWGLEGAFGYAATRLLASAGFQEPSDRAPPSDDATRLFGTVVVPITGLGRLRTEGQFAVFDTSVGLTPYATVTHMARDGRTATLAPGSQVAYSTRFVTGSVEASVGTWGSISHEVFLGYTLFTVNSSEWMQLSQADSIFSALVDLDRTCHAASLRMVPQVRALKPGFSWYAKPFYYFGLGSARSPWFDKSSFCFGQGGELAVRYLGRGYGVVIGYSVYELGFLGGDELELSHDLHYVTPGGEARRAPAGSTWSGALTSKVRYMGPFLQVSFGI